MSELVAIEKINAVDVFVDLGLEPFLEKIEKEVKASASSLDISTEQGRKEIASLAYKVARSKTALDDLGKNLTEEWKAKSKAVDAERKRMRDKLDTLKDEIRLPLTEWEDKEKARVEGFEAAIAEITEGGKVTSDSWQTLPLDAMRDRLKEIEADGARDWQEFAGRGKYAVDTATAAIRAAIEKREGYDAEQAELAKLRQEKVEREQKEREEKIAAEAAAKAKAEAEAKAKGELEEAARRTKEAEAAKKAAEEKAEREKIAAEEKSKRDAEAAAKAERDHIEAKKKAEADAAVRREADKKHKAKINNEALNVLKNLVDEDKGKAIIEAIAKGHVPHIKISY